MKTIFGLLIVVFISLSIAPAISSEVYFEQAKCNCTCPCSQYPIMHPDSETLQEWLECYNSAPPAYIDAEFEPPTGSLSLLSHLEYDPVERDQGSCGNCWVWGGTGVLEIALDVQEGIKDRLSIQYLNSKYNGGTGSDWACCGGWLEYLANFYASEGFVIPWSNTNAAWADGTQTCSDGTTVPWDTISTSPSYTITGCSVESITTHDVGSTTAINNIKNVLAQDKAIWFAFFLPTGDDWNQFFDFWNYESEDVIWNPDYSCGHVWDDGGGGHAVLCVGYNDDDPENSYWVMVNSWGTTSGRPNGIFHLDMDMNYDCCSYDGPSTYDNFYWETLDVTFDVGECPSLHAEEDSYVRENEPNTNFGDDWYLYVSNYTYFGEEQVYMKFDLSEIPFDSTIVSATLALYCFYVDWIPIYVEAHYCSDNSWTEMGITWNNKPSYDPTATDTQYVSVEDTWYSWDISTDVQQALSSGYLTEVMISTDMFETGVEFYSREYSTTPYLGPTLTICYESATPAKIGDLKTTWKDATLVLGTSQPYGPLLWGALIDDTVGAISLAGALGAYGDPDSAFDAEVAEWGGASFSWKIGSPSSVIAIGGTGVNLVSYEYNSYVHFGLSVTADYVEFEVDAGGIDYIRLYFSPSHYVIHYSDDSEVQYDSEENDFAEAYAYYDSVNNKYVFLVMGICAEGTIGACKYLATNLASFPTDVTNAQGIILHWHDANGDGIAKGDEMTVIATYP